MSIPVGSDSWNWFYGHLKSKSSNFSSAKTYENHFRKHTSDSENDSGYAPSNDCRKFIKLPYIHRSNMADSASHEDCDDEDEEEDIGEEEEASEIHRSIETIVEGLLGSTLDDASVDRIYNGFPEYEKIFACYHSQLVNAIRNLSHSLQRALHGISHEKDITPTAAHSALKCLVLSLIADCQELPYLESAVNNEGHSSDNMSLIDIDIFCSYEGLVASAIINKVIEEVQAKFVINKISQSGVSSTNKNIPINGDETEPYERDSTAIHEDSEIVDDSFSISELPLECVQVEEIEEVTQEYTDSEDDKFSNISHPSVRLHSVEELGTQRYSSEDDLFCGVKLESNWKAPFPEFGPDLVDSVEEVKDRVTSYPVFVSCWEDNWLFRKKKVLPLHSSIKYQLLAYYDEPACMLIPCPSANAYANETEDSTSELSESHSVGSLELFSDSECSTDGNIKQDTFRLEECSRNVAKAETDSHLHDMNISSGSPDLEKNGLKNIFNLNEKAANVQISITSQENSENISNHTADNCSSNTKQHQAAIVTPSKLHLTCESSFQTALQMENKHHESEKQFLQDACNAAGDILLIPTQPGTIAEREHKKWMNAVHLKNNPYSAENISRRNSFSSHKQFAMNVSQRLETLNEFSYHNIEKPLKTERYCGLNSIDRNRYDRDYYINSSRNGQEQNSVKFVPCFEPFNSEGSVPEETLNSLEEKVYISAGKVFTLENHVQRLEREVKDLSLSSDSQAVSHADDLYHNKAVKHLDISSTPDESNLTLPSVRVLATKFNSEQDVSKCNYRKPLQQQLIHGCISERLEDVKGKRSRPCVKVHSLTARSLSREFRDRAKQNLPKPMNRLLSIPPQMYDETLCEQYSISSNVSQSDVTHGYTSDESSNSSSSLPHVKASKHISQSVLQRASYWERRVEQGLLSDASVSEEFPGFETTSA